MDTTPLRILVASVIWTVVSAPLGATALQIRRLHVPAFTELHRPALLSCEYDSKGEPLYAVKWYKDRQEFYRYLADETPKIRVFDLDGVDVDATQSNDTALYLRNITFKSAGEYTCEVSLDRPTFLTAVTKAHMNVLYLPKEGPRISGLDDTYVPGQTMEANCTIAPSYPQAALRWFLNGKEVARSLLNPSHQVLSVQTRPVPSWLAVKIPVQPEVFVGQQRRLELRCQATIADRPPKDVSVTASLRDLPAPGNQRLAQPSLATATRAHSACRCGCCHCC